MNFLLLYADDIVLLAPSAAQMQSLIDKLHQFCQDMGLEINETKTEMVVFDGSSDLYPHTWHLQGQPLPQSTSFKYLGLHFQKNCSFDAMIEKMLHRGKMAVAKTWARIKALGLGQPSWVALHLFKSYVESSCLYACEIWGTKLALPQRQRRTQGQRHTQAFESLQVQFCKHACGVNPNTPSHIVMSELEARPLFHACWLRIIEFWNGLGSAPEGDLYKLIFMDNLKDAVAHDVNNWSNEVITGARRLGFNFPLRCDFAEPIDVTHFKETLEAKDAMAWVGLQVDPRTCQDRVKLCTYQNWFARLKPGQSYLKLPISSKDMRVMLRFRMGCHNLPIEMGRRHGIPRAQRVCTLCDTGSVGDERHLLFECPTLSGVRANFSALLARSNQCMRHMLWDKDQMMVHRYLKACMTFSEHRADSASSHDSEDCHE